jgi:hypothetical protein
VCTHGKGAHQIKFQNRGVEIQGQLLTSYLGRPNRAASLTCIFIYKIGIIILVLSSSQACEIRAMRVSFEIADSSLVKEDRGDSLL